MHALIESALKHLDEIAELKDGYINEDDFNHCHLIAPTPETVQAVRAILDAASVYHWDDKDSLALGIIGDGGIDIEIFIDSTQRELLFSVYISHEVTRTWSQIWENKVRATAHYDFNIRLAWVFGVDV